MVGAVILAAGRGRRMGGKPKALLTLEGRTFLERVTASCHDARCCIIWIVAPPGLPGIADLAFQCGARLIINPEPERGMFSSVQTGLDAILGEDETIDAVIIYPVDHPRVSGETIESLIHALTEKPEKTWIQPVYKKRRGHPILVGAAAAHALLELSPTVTLRDALKQCGLKPYDVQVEDPGILENINTPGDVK